MPRRSKLRQRNTPEFERQYASFMNALVKLEEANRSGRVVQQASNAWIEAYNLAHVVLHDKQVPAADVKLFERTMREFNRKRLPRKLMQWYEKHMPSIKLLAQTHRWPDKSASREQSHDIEVRVDEHGMDASFVVHNQTGKDATATLKMLESAANLALSSGMPRIDEVIYGDVYLVGEVERNKNWKALYLPDGDLIRVVLSPRFDDHVIMSTIHELGHRYWQKILGHDARRAWSRHHYEIEKAAVASIEPPKAGDVIPDPKGDLIVQDVSPHPRYDLVINLIDPKHPSRSLSIKYTTFIKVERDNAMRRAYPTPYARTDEQEHFCEALALFCMGELPEPHRAKFVEIFDVQEKVEPPTPAESAPAEPGRPGQLAMFNPRQRALTRRIGRL